MTAISLLLLLLHYQVMASKEVILSGGVIFTPHLLLKSGIGPREELEAMGMKVYGTTPTPQLLYPPFYHNKNNITLHIVTIP